MVQLADCGAVFLLVVSLKLLPSATNPATAGCPLWAGFARGAVSHSRPAQGATPGRTLTLSYLVCGASVLLN